MPQTLPTPPGFSYGRLLGNLIALAAVLLAAAYCIDWLWTVFGGTPWASCTLLSWVDGVVAPVLGLVVFLGSGYSSSLSMAASRAPA
jgi:hypothetical protein